MFFDQRPIRPKHKHSGIRSKNNGKSRNDMWMLAKVEEYWRSLIGTRQVPLRSDIDPSRLGDALQRSMIIERIAPGHARVRMAGQWINQTLGMDARGMPASVLVAPESRMVFGGQIEAAFAGPAIVEIPLELSRGWARKALAGRMMILPLADEDERITRALAIVATEGSPMTGSYPRFEVDHNGAFRCAVMPRALREGPPVPGADRRAAPAAAVRALPLFSVIEGDGTPAVKSDPAGDRPALRVVVNNG